MAKKWRRIRTVVTLVMSVFCLCLLTAAGFSLGHVSGEAVVDMAVLGLVLPFGFYGVYTLVGWQRTTDREAEPGALVAWCLKHRLGMIAPIAFMFCLLGLIQNLGTALSRPSREAVASADQLGAFRTSCVAAAGRGVRDAGGDPAGAETLVRNFCGCVATEMQADYTQDELATFAADQTHLAKDTKYNRIMERCQRANHG